MTYPVIFEKAPRNYAAYVPDLPGCVATGETRQDVERLIREGIHLRLETLRDDGQPIPEPTASAELVEA